MTLFRRPFLEKKFWKWEDFGSNLEYLVQEVFFVFSRNWQLFVVRDFVSLLMKVRLFNTSLKNRSPRRAHTGFGCICGSLTWLRQTKLFLDFSFVRSVLIQVIAIPYYHWLPAQNRGRSRDVFTSVNIIKLTLRLAHLSANYQEKVCGNRSAK